MSEFLLRILFSGLIAFVPNQNSTEVDVLLINVPHDYETSNGASLSHHKPLLVATSGNCTGSCPQDDLDAARYLYADKSDAQALDALEIATAGGGVWQLGGSQLSVRRGSTSDPALPALSITRNVRGSVNGVPQLIPTTSTERKDFSWLAKLSAVCETGCDLDSALLTSNPPPGIIAARFKLDTGTLSTFAVARIGGDVTPVHFQRLDNQGTIPSYTQAVASWMAADIRVSASTVEIYDSAYNSGAGRSMKLSPNADGIAEVAVINLPPFVPPATSSNTGGVGMHFEAYYELGTNPPAKSARRVPKAGAAPNSASYPSVSWHTVHPASAVGSDLLSNLRLDIGRSAYDVTLCPMSCNSDTCG